MNILMLSDVFFPDTIGGAGRVAYHLGLELNKKGHFVHVLTRNPQNRLLPFQKMNHHFLIHRFNVPLNESFSLVFSEVKNSYQVSKRLLHESDFNIVCINQCMSAIGPLLHKQLKRLPAVYLYYSPWHQEFLTKRKNGAAKNSINERVISQVMKWTERRFLKIASRIIVLSNFSSDQVSYIHGITSDKTSIVPGGVDLTNFRLSTQEKNKFKTKSAFPEDKTLFVTVRNLVPRMGIDNLIEAFNQSQILRNNSILLIGGQGPLENSLKSRVESYRLKDVVHFVGHIPDVKLPLFYQAADYFILPTAALEGFGLVILEAMACGIPVLGTPVGAIPEIIGRFDKRLLFEGSSWRDIKKKLEQVVEKPDQYNFDPQKCREFVEKNYSWKKMADAFEKKALELIATSKREF